MIRPRHPLTAVLFATVLAVTALGCGGGAQQKKLTGKVILPTNIKVVENDGINLTFAPDPKGTTVVAEVSPKDLTFSTQIPPGKYKVAVEITPYPGEKDSEKRATAFEKFNEKYGSSVSPLSYEVTADASQNITVDLAQNRVAKE
jgi:hypothetical protein